MVYYYYYYVCSFETMHFVSLAERKRSSHVVQGSASWLVSVARLSCQVENSNCKVISTVDLCKIGSML